MSKNVRCRPAAAIASVALSLCAPVALIGCGGGETVATPTTEAAPTTEVAPTVEAPPATEAPSDTTSAETETAPAKASTTPPAPTTVSVVVSGGKVVGGIHRPTVARGDTVILVVRSDVADEVHLHGYDVSRDVAAGGEARIRFAATIPGRFEVELEHRGQQLAEITVEP